MRIAIDTIRTRNPDLASKLTAIDKNPASGDGDDFISLKEAMRLTDVKDRDRVADLFADTFVASMTSRERQLSAVAAEALRDARTELARLDAQPNDAFNGWTVSRRERDRTDRGKQIKELALYSLVRALPEHHPVSVAILARLPNLVFAVSSIVGVTLPAQKVDDTFSAVERMLMSQRP